MIHAHRYLAVSKIIAAAGAGCVEPSDLDRSSLAPATELEAVSSLEEVPRECGTRRTFLLDGADPSSELTGDVPEAAAVDCPIDYYFHPNNGAHGGWIESWRLCFQGGGQYKICAGGSAPVRFWNPSSCNGTVHDFYPQGWHGWVQTGGGCC